MIIMYVHVLSFHCLYSQSIAVPLLVWLMLPQPPGAAATCGQCCQGGWCSSAAACLMPAYTSHRCSCLLWLPESCCMSRRHSDIAAASTANPLPSSLTPKLHGPNGQWCFCAFFRKKGFLSSVELSLHAPLSIRPHDRSVWGLVATCKALRISMSWGEWLQHATSSPAKERHTA